VDFFAERLWVMYPPAVGEDCLARHRTWTLSSLFIHQSYGRFMSMYLSERQFEMAGLVLTCGQLDDGSRLLLAALNGAEWRSPSIEGEIRRAAAERAVRRRLGVPLTPGISTPTGVLPFVEVARLENHFKEWRDAERSRTVKAAALALHRAGKVDPLAAEHWLPGLVRRRGGLRDRFLRVLRVLWRARERGLMLGRGVEDDLASLGGALQAAAAGIPAPSHGARRCEGRSRAPQGSSGGARVGGGSRRGGGDDDSGGGDPGDPDGPSRSWWHRVNWPAVGGITGILSLLATVAGLTFGLPGSQSAPVQKVIIREVRTVTAHHSPRPGRRSSSGTQARELRSPRGMNRSATRSSSWRSVTGRPSRDWARWTR
jgi:hypothetical protein